MLLAAVLAGGLLLVYVVVRVWLGRTRPGQEAATPTINRRNAQALDRMAGDAAAAGAIQEEAGKEAAPQDLVEVVKAASEASRPRRAAEVARRPSA